MNLRYSDAAGGGGAGGGGGGGGMPWPGFARAATCGTGLGYTRLVVGFATGTSQKE